jgi:hypothetical protein
MYQHVCHAINMQNIVSPALCVISEVSEFMSLFVRYIT